MRRERWAILRYDAAIIGAGADGLAAAVTLARAGLKVVVLERNEQPGGRAVTREFHPGFQASPFCDELAPIPAEVFWALDLARHGALFMSSAASTALWPDRATTLSAEPSRLRAKGAALAQAALRRAAGDTAPSRKSFFTKPAGSDEGWPGDEWAMESLTGLLAAEHLDSDAQTLVLADALSGRVAHPGLAGSALHLLIAAGSGQVIGGLQRLTGALMAAAQAAGVEISCGLEVSDILRHGGRAAGLRRADGTDIAARVVISTLDLKRTFLSLFAWNDLPPAVSSRVASFRMIGGTARLLFALDRLPEPPSFARSDLFAGPIHAAPDSNAFGAAYAAWRAGTIAEYLPITLRFPSVADPRSCPTGGATMTATVAGVPARPFDGAWTHEKRDALRRHVLAAIERVLPGLTARVLACELLTPTDIEQALGCTEGDLWGGEIAADQMLAYRPWLDCPAPRTPIKGLYLAGRSTTAGVLGTCVSGVLAARAVTADLKAGHLK